VIAHGGAPGILGFSWPEVLPGGTHALVTYWRNVRALDSARVGIVSIADGTLEDLGLPGSNPHYVSPGYIVFARVGDEVHVAPFSLGKRRLTGPDAVLLQSVRVGGGGAASIAVSQNGTLAYVSGVRRETAVAMFAVDRRGVEQQLTREATDYQTPRVSPDGRRILASLGVSVGGDGGKGIVVYDIAQGTSTLLSADSNSSRGEWTRDGSRVWYRQVVADSVVVWARSWNLSSPPQVIARGSGDAFQEMSPGPLRGLSAIRSGSIGPNSHMRSDILLAPTESLAATRPLFTGVAPMDNPRVSPDGLLLAYTSNETGSAEVYVTPIPGPAARVRVSVDGGTEPAWSWDGKTLFYRTGRNRIGLQATTPIGGRLMAATMAERPELAVTRRDSLFADIYVRGRNHAAYDVFPDGRFVMLRPSTARGTGRGTMFVVVNWPQLIATPDAERER
jgi:eukaryotic-like serine/threonine-protein kinase